MGFCNTLGVFSITILLAVKTSDAMHLSQNIKGGLLTAMPKNCTNMDYCLEQDSSYPQNQIDVLLDKYPLRLESDIEILSHRDGDESDQRDCAVELFPYNLVYEIVDENDLVRFVIQSPGKFEQIIRIERCLNPGPILHQTSHLWTPVQYNKVSCEDTLLGYSFWVLTLDGEGVELVKTKNGIPVCCRCVYNEHKNM